MARNRVSDLLPELFKTDTNKEFLNSTLDQLTQEPKLKKTQGYVGRKFVKNGDDNSDYVIEPTQERANYQLEPGVVFNDENNNPINAITYPEIIDTLSTEGANVSRHDRLFSSNIYSWNPLIDFDKFVNHSQYYWLPGGPDSVDVSATDLLLTNDFDVTDNGTTYSISDQGGTNPTITLARGGSYKFNVNQTGKFWIQTEPGTDGKLNSSPNISTRDILGVTNNGEENGTVTFNVPKSDAQIFYDNLTKIDNIDLATFDRFDSINGAYLSELGNIDGVLDLENKTIVFLDQTAGNSADLGWEYDGFFDRYGYDDETHSYDEVQYIDSQADRYSIYQIQYVTVNGDVLLKLNRIKSVAVHEKFDVLYGETYSNKSFYKNSNGYFAEVPNLTASRDVLYYQDGSDSNKVGVINLVDSTTDAVLKISEDILGNTTYTSPNGVTFTNGLKVIFRGNVEPEAYQDNAYYVEGVGTAIKLVSVFDLITPETFIKSETEVYDLSAFDSSGFDGNLNSPTTLDFITINRSSSDLNPWSRSNRWVHKDVILKTAEYNNTTAVFDNNYRANRPIIEFDANLKLFNFGTVAKQPVTAIDFVQTDALSNINGSTGFTIDGFTITNGARVIFAADLDSEVRNKIYEVTFNDFDNDGTTSIELVEASDSIVLKDECVVCTNGNTLQGKTYTYNGTEWISSQQKTGTNQAPLFDISDINGYSFSDTDVYPNTTFAGNKLFSYKQGTGTNDTVLGFPLSYLNIDNIGDIVFNNDLYLDTFEYDVPSVSKKVSDGYVRKYSSRTAYTNEIGWTESAEKFIQPQVFNFDYDGTSLILDVVGKSGLDIPNTQVYVDNEFVTSDKYTVTTSDNKTVITFNYSVTEGTECRVEIISDTASSVGYYKIPVNLENNPFNQNNSTLTLGNVRNHYTSLAKNISNLEGELSGANNLRDLGNVSKYGRAIIQNSSPLAVVGKFLHSTEFNFFKSLEFNSHAYEKYKLKILDYVAKNDVYGKTAYDILDEALSFINQGKSSLNAFHKSDMLAGSSNPTLTTYTVTAITGTTFNTVEIYDFTKANSKAINVYINDTIITKDTDYTVSSDSPTISITKTLNVGDVIKIREYETTVGSYVPNTPTKIGLYPRYIPKKYSDNTYVTTTDVIRGHDGSITVAFGDTRDDVLLEFENRIYNNIKVDSPVPIEASDIIPGKFRTTDYSDEEVTSILSTSFLNWVGYNRLDYKTQDYSSANEFTWNYSTASSQIDGDPLKGHWRGCYFDYYDTDTPHTTPWQMLGLSEKPTWWEDAYGPAPYTSGNMVLWEDLEAGLIKDPSNTRTVEKYKRPGLTEVIPVDSSGNLLSPFVSQVRNYNQPDFRKNWVFGDIGPVENAWRKSSSYRFSLMRLYALTKPAEFFNLCYDRDTYVYNNDLSQYLLNDRYRIDIRNTQRQTVNNPKHSYINWVADYHNNNGCSCQDINDELALVDIRLCYRVAGFTDKNYLKIYTDKSSPESTNTGLLLPDQSYNLLLHKNQALTELQYSSVIVQKTENGYSVYGHGSSQQYFEILNSITDRNGIKLGDYVVPTKFTNKVTTVPYGYTFTTKGAVIDFLASYGAFLTDKGLIFNTQENGTELNWSQMINEYLAWSAQDWGNGAIINLNPCAISLEFNKELLIVDNINNNITDALDQNGIPLDSNDYVITRLDNSFKIKTINNKSINFLRIKSVSYEHLLVLDNESVFNDLIYQVNTGLRQQRIRLVGFTTYDWNGQLDAQGFILNQDNVEEWKENKFYSMGSLVTYKNSYWTAVSRLQPKDEFSFNDWAEIDYSSIKKGLLPNLANKAEQIREYYNKKSSNLENDVDLLAMGLIGFRPREYLSSLDDISQVNFYSDFVRNKGTLSSADVFRDVKVDKKVTDYEIYENWLIKESTYGSSDNKRYVEFELVKQKLKNNPAIVEVVDNNSTKVEPHQLVKIDDIYNQSYKNTTTDIFPTRTSKLTDTTYPTSGFVFEDDVDIAVNKLTDLVGSSGIAFANTIKDGSLIWVANDNNYSWNVYRADANTELLISDFALVYDSDAGDWSLTTADSEWLASDSETATFKLTSVRVQSESDLTTDDYVSNLPTDALAWVDSNTNSKNSVYKNTNTGWELLREEKDEVDVELINRVLAYDVDTDITTVNFDYIDPINGKILGQISENIDYVSSYDPAVYTQGTNTTGVVWGANQEGRIWWDTTEIRFLDANQTDIDYSTSNWGKAFPGSTADIRQWVKSTVPPSQYSGSGSVVDSDSYTVVTRINSSDTIITEYYFWVTGLETKHESKTYSTEQIKDYILDPKSSGIPYVAFIDSSTVAIYNAQKYIENNILHTSYNKLKRENDIFTEYSLIKENNKYEFLSDQLYLKLQDSFIGGNKIGLAVPDKALNKTQRIGTQFRPRQTMFENRFQALNEYLTKVNSILSEHIISTNKDFTKLNDEELIPGSNSGEYDLKVANLDELNYQNLDLVSVGYKYLVENDTDNNGGWSIYEVVSGQKLELIKIQSYDTTRSWDYIDWYADSDARQSTATKLVDDASDLTSLDVEDGTYAKISSNSNGKWELYQLVDGTWVIKGLEDGTISFNSSLWNGTSSIDNLTIDSELFTTDTKVITADKGTGGNELRNIIRAINEDLFKDDLLDHRIETVIDVFNYILSENTSVDWLMKTSFIDVEHKIRDLEQYSTYKKDDQEFLLNYLNESKPYHVKIKEFLLRYDGNEQYNTDIADFDCPAYYDTTFGKYISPILDYPDVILKTDQSNFDDDGIGLKETDYNIWELDPWDNWYNNKATSIKSVNIVNAGSNFTEAPTLTVTGGGASVQAKLTCKIDSSGEIVDVTVVDGGTGYYTTPTITVGTGNSSAILTPVMQNSLVRTINTTLNYNRCEYTTQVVDWEAGVNPLVTADIDTVTVDSVEYFADRQTSYLVRFNNKVYTQNTQGAFASTFSLDDFTEVDPATLSAADRTMGYYTPGDNNRGLNLAMLINGIDYPGVVVKDKDFSDSAGFSVLPYDTDAFDTIEVDADGSALYGEGELDTDYTSSFNDIYLGTRPEDIITDGGEFVDTYSSHAPEELVPGSMFDTLDLLVHTRPSFDYTGNGHGWEIDYKLYTYRTSGSATFSFENVVAHPTSILVINSTTRTTLHIDDEYTVDWVNKEITIIDGVNDGDTIQIQVYEIGGGNQLYRSNIVGTDISAKQITIPVKSQEIYDIVLTLNGTILKTGYTATSDGKLTVDGTLTTADSTALTVDTVSEVSSSNTVITFTDTYDASDFISITVFGFESTQHDYSFPITTHFTGSNGADTDRITADDTTITADNISTNYDLGSYVSLVGVNKENAIVEKNGKRLRPPEGKRYTGDNSTTDFRLPTVGLVDHTLVSNSEIVVFVDDIKQTLSTDYTVISVTVGSDTFKDVRFTTAPDTDAKIDVYMTYPAEYTIDSAGILRIKSSVSVAGEDEIDVITWNDTDQQDILTSTFVGPTTTTTEIVELFDSGGFDSVSFDFVGSSSTDVNLFDLYRTVDNDKRIWVTLNGDVLTPDLDYSISGSNLLLAGELIGPTDVVSVTSFTSSVVPDALSFRLFKDMNGNQAMYRVKTCCLNKIELTENLAIDDDTIYLNDVSNLAVPNLETGIFGIVLINGERITYRNVDSVANTISGLRRGTAGTGIKAHTKEDVVYDMGIGELVENSLVESNTFGSDINTSETAYDKIWYAQGSSTASDGVALQRQETTQAVFIKQR